MFGAFLRGCISYFVHHQYPSNQPTTPPLNKCRSETMFVTPGSFDIPTEWAQDICKKLHAMGYKKSGWTASWVLCVLRHVPDREGLLSSNFSGVNLRRRDFNPSKCVSKAFFLGAITVESQGMPVMPAQTVVVEFRLPGVLFGLPGWDMEVLGRLQFQYWNHFPSRGHRFGVYLYNSRTRAGGD